MKIVILLLSTVIFGLKTFSQDGKIITKERYTIPDSVLLSIKEYDSALVEQVKNVNFFRITYLSDGLKVTGYVAQPKAKGKYPCIISNRGGNRDFGA